MSVLQLNCFSKLHSLCRHSKIRISARGWSTGPGDAASAAPGSRSAAIVVSVLRRYQKNIDFCMENLLLLWGRVPRVLLLVANLQPEPVYMSCSHQKNIDFTKEKQ